MSYKGNYRALFHGIQGDVAKAVEDAGGKLANFGENTLKRSLDSIAAVEKADGAGAQGLRGVDGDAHVGASPAGSVGARSPARSPGEVSRRPKGDATAGSLSEKSPTDGAATRTRFPAWLRRRLEKGRAFNKENQHRYPHNEVQLDGGRRVDSYRHTTEIVERKNTQLNQINKSTATRYIDSLRTKYGPGQMIADTPKNRAEGISGERLKGSLILEVPPQTAPIPRDVLEYAARRRVIIRDTNGKIYN